MIEIKGPKQRQTCTNLISVLNSGVLILVERVRNANGTPIKCEVLA